MRFESKYIFNSKTLSYDVSRSHPHAGMRKAGAVAGISLVLFAAAFFICTQLLSLPTPKSLWLKHRNSVLVRLIALLNTEVDQHDEALSQLQMRDNNVYRPIFGMDEISQQVRSAGFGGVDRYDYLDHYDNGDFLISSRMKLDIVTKKAYIQSLSYGDVSAISKRAGDMASCVPNIMPVCPTKKIKFSSSFGYRSDPFRGTPKFHSGIDLSGPKGEPIYATGNGVVVHVRYNYYGYGNVVDIDHGFGYVTRYGHLKDAVVVEGQRVVRGDQIGTLGNSGRSSGPHLHYEVIFRGKAINPWNYLNNDLSPEEYRKMISNREVTSDRG